jgi:dihydroorotate dehydrogenase (fumarate)
MGLDLKNPIIAASSGFTDNLRTLKELEKNGCAAVVLKSLFEEEIIKEMKATMGRMNSDSFMYPETVDYYEYLDVPLLSSDKYLEFIKEAKINLNIPVIASINCITAGQWTYYPKQIEAAGADAIELNLFIMPTDFKRSAEQNEKMYFDIINEVTKSVKIPVSIKISHYFSNLGQMIQKFSETGIAGIVLFNRYYSPDFDIENMEVISSNVLSHPSDLTLSLRWIAIMANRVKCDLAASTGIHQGADVIKQLLAGANVVQVASALYKHGPSQIKEMLDELEDWMERHKYFNIEEFRGKMSQSVNNNPAAYERVQFMKYFRSQDSQHL